jgi:hypothetical protein
MKDACVLPDAGDTVFQIHCLERSAYASVLRAFCAVTNHLSWVYLLAIPISYTGSKYQYSNHRKYKLLDKFNLIDVYNFVLNADLTEIFCFCVYFSSEWWLFACSSHYFSSIPPCHATCFISAYL